MKKRIGIICAAGILFVLCSCEKENQALEIISFEELRTDSTGYWNGSDGSGGFASGNANFPNTFTVWEGGFKSWTGFAYSTLTDQSTPGFVNQYSCYAGSGATNSETFALITNGDTLTFKIPERVDKISVANSTYTALSMKEGDDFSKKFGGPDGNDPDFFHLIIEGIDEKGDITGSITLALADFTSDNAGEDYISDSWTEIPLDALGFVKQLAFSFNSSDKGEWGINTPKYACLDNITGTLK